MLLLRATLHSRSQGTGLHDAGRLHANARHRRLLLRRALSLLRPYLGQLLPAEAMPADAALPAGGLRQSDALPKLRDAVVKRGIRDWGLGIRVWHRTLFPNP